VTGGRPGPPGLAWDTKPQDRTVDSTPRNENLIPYFTLAWPGCRGSCAVPLAPHGVGTARRPIRSWRTAARSNEERPEGLRVCVPCSPRSGTRILGAPRRCAAAPGDQHRLPPV